MTTLTGAKTVNDLLQVKYASAIEYGLDKMYSILATDLSNYNEQVRELVGDLAERVTIQARAFEANSGQSFSEVDEFGIPTGQKDFGSYEVAYPLKKYVFGLGWTSEYFAMKTPAEITADYNKLQLADQKNLVLQVKKAIYNNTNVSFTDVHDNGVALTIRRFWNADSATIPTNRSGSSFAGASHTHYNAIASTLTNAEVDGLVQNVTEHDQYLGIGLYVSGSTLNELDNLSEFKALRSDLMIPSTASDATIDTLSISDLSNYQAGIWNGKYPVFVRPWCIDGYVTALALGGEKPLAFRESRFPAMQGLKLDGLVTVNPMITQTATRYAGFGVNNRSAGAVLYIGNTTWANPTIS